MALSNTEAALAALHAKLIAKAVEGSPKIPPPSRNLSLPGELAEFSGVRAFLNTFDGDIRWDDQLLGDAQAHYELKQPATISWVVEGVDPAARDTVFDDGLQALIAALFADRTLGGAVAGLEVPTVRRRGLATDGLAHMRACAIEVEMLISSTLPI
jgi:hypothetical protein